MTVAGACSHSAIVVLHKNLGNIPVLEVVVSINQQAELPLAVGYHGWTNVKESILTEAMVFARAGYRVLLPDACLHGERRPAGHAYQVFPDLYDTLQHNVQELPQLLAAARQAGIPFSSVSIFGRSMGGMSVSMLAVRYHEQLAGVAHFIGSPDPSAVFEAFLAGSQAKMDPALSAPDPAKVAQVRAFLADHNLSRQPEVLADLPYFAYHGGQDDWVSVQYNRDLAAAMQVRWPAAPYRYLEFPAEDHWVPFESMQAAVQFLRSRLK